MKAQKQPFLTILLVTFTMLSVQLKAQNFNFCGTEPNGSAYRMNNAQFNRSAVDMDTKYVFKVKVHFIKSDDGTYPANHTAEVMEAKTLDIVAALNMNFNDFKIYFKYTDYNVINDSRLLDFDNHYYGEDVPLIYDWQNDILPPANTLLDDEYIDIFIVDRFVNFQSQTEVGSLGFMFSFNNYEHPLQDVENRFIAIRDVDISGKAVLPVVDDENIIPNGLEYTLIHEMGHYFGLYHTHRQWIIDPENPNSFIHIAYANDYCTERIYEFQDGTNWFEAGDFIQDTNADRSRSDYGVSYDGPTEANPFNCEINLNNLYVDQCGELLIDPLVYDPPKYNIMSYYLNCMYQFTEGQKFWMRDFIQTFDFFDTGLIDVAELYEPYKGDYYNVGIIMPNHFPYFQKGFDYEFVNCQDNHNYFPQPAEYGEDFVFYEDLSSENNLSIPLHQNHTAFRILQIDDSRQPEKCYNNWNRGAISGSVIHFLDGTLNANINIQSKDSLQINNPNLIPNLNEGLYKIKKNYEDGSTKENIIYKNNN